VLSLLTFGDCERLGACIRLPLRNRPQRGMPATRAGRDCGSSGSVALPVVADCTDVSRSVVIDVIELVGTVFSGLSVLVIEDVEDAGEVICVRARTRDVAVACPGRPARPA